MWFGHDRRWRGYVAICIKPADSGVILTWLAVLFKMDAENVFTHRERLRQPMMRCTLELFLQNPT